MNLDLPLRRRLLVYVPAFLALVLLQLKLSLDGYRPQADFLMLLPLLAALWTPGYDPLVLGLAAGFIRDYAAGRGYGLGMLAGMALALIGNRMARDGWRMYAIRGSILVVGATLVHSWLLSFLAYLIPLEEGRANFVQVMRVWASHLPLSLVLNLAASLAITAYLTLTLPWRTAAFSSSSAGPVKEVAHE
jgi:hypothetical protein